MKNTYHMDIMSPGLVTRIESTTYLRILYYAVLLKHKHHRDCLLKTLLLPCPALKDWLQVFWISHEKLGLIHIGIWYTVGSGVIVGSGIKIFWKLGTLFCNRESVEDCNIYK